MQELGEYWSTRALEHWSSGVLEQWSTEARLLGRSPKAACQWTTAAVHSGFSGRPVQRCRATQRPSGARQRSARTLTFEAARGPHVLPAPSRQLPDHSVRQTQPQAMQQPPQVVGPNVAAAGAVEEPARTDQRTQRRTMSIEPLDLPPVFLGGITADSDGRCPTSAAGHPGPTTQRCAAKVSELVGASAPLMRDVRSAGWGGCGAPGTRRLVSSIRSVAPPIGFWGLMAGLRPYHYRTDSRSLTDTTAPLSHTSSHRKQATRAPPRRVLPNCDTRKTGRPHIPAPTGKARHGASPPRPAPPRRRT
jgi:hypothetical protein